MPYAIRSDENSHLVLFPSFGRFVFSIQKMKSSSHGLSAIDLLALSLFLFGTAHSASIVPIRALVLCTPPPW
jgi:hypothetical protein